MLRVNSAEESIRNTFSGVQGIRCMSANHGKTELNIAV
jgi:hypothetical protein